MVSLTTVSRLSTVVELWEKCSLGGLNLGPQPRRLAPSPLSHDVTLIERRLAKRKSSQVKSNSLLTVPQQLLDNDPVDSGWLDHCRQTVELTVVDSGLARTLLTACQQCLANSG